MAKKSFVGRRNSGRMVAVLGCFIGMAAVASGAEARVEVSGKDGNVRLKAGSLQNAGTVSSDSPLELSATVPAEMDWKEFIFRFEPQNDGIVVLSLAGSGASNGDQPRVKFAEISVDHQDFSAGKDGKSVVDPKLANWNSDPGAKLDGGAENSWNAEVCHDRRVHRRLSVEAGKTYTVRAKVKALDAAKK